ncbi:MAG: hypothetical protein LBQ52_04835 [Helicobacteraceae bacterium]|jgi:hypothetical protein|nr:hypothetical protein [Helicobacteraceae bacterium]
MADKSDRLAIRSIAQKLAIGAKSIAEIYDGDEQDVFSSRTSIDNTPIRNCVEIF